jgi:hypothetical protein
LDFGPHFIPFLVCLQSLFLCLSVLSLSMHDFINLNSCNDKWYGIQTRKLSFPFRLLVTFWQ